MGYYSTFPWGIPQIEADSIRVPHPCAGRRRVQALPLPLDLHVLGLPLAFILSQDQTLHCNVVVCFLAINSRIIDKVFCIPCFLNQYVKNLFLFSLSIDWGGKCKKVFSNTATLICFFSKKFSLWKTV